MGARYPWESALTGAEVCPAVAEDVRDQEVDPLEYFSPVSSLLSSKKFILLFVQIHISADISLGLRLALDLGVDKGWWKKEKGGHTACQVGQKTLDADAE